MLLKPTEITTIIYEKSADDVSSRVILPVSIPGPNNVRAIDLSDVPVEQRLRFQQLLKEYTEYKDQFIKNMLSFENWVDHSYNEQISPKWRSFAVDKIK